jgi:hypothetical protein
MWPATAARNRAAAQHAPRGAPGTLSCARARRLARGRCNASGRAGRDVLLDASVRVPHALSTLALGDLGDRAAAHDREWLVLENVGLISFARLFVPGLDQQPRLLAFAASAIHAHEVPAAAQLLPIKREVEMTLLVALVRVALGVPMAAVPDHHGAAAILSLRDRALEAVVFDRMILDMDREPLLAGNEARTARHRPALHHAVELEPQIIMQAARGVLLNDEAIALASRRVAARLRRHVELALLAINLQAHGCEF